ncbi:hypothetical protein PR202_gb22451 [Eleusine coracana subsp. coracana]|uniref:Peptidase A1 domain-containing protein n=1 Tax=Eleusine coracana subsp. coracana TaxID=191504 RepID=A0AAV5FHQ7_ELECO|nr:hypothetical protein QOZ80_6AG0537070 [Eleusine coracana subsp. coracana]GJN33825.1 hypothetical protein PR202_gb22451 [Eleusine coracana subsp. coracana]
MSRLAVFLLFLLQLQLQHSSVVRAANGDFGFTATLRRADANMGYTEVERLGHAFKRTKARVAALQSLATAPPPTSAVTEARILVRASAGEYLMDLGIGTPPRFFTAILDTAHDLIWTQCASSQYFDPARSATYSPLPCSSPTCGGLGFPSCVKSMCEFDYFYVNSTKHAVLATETFTFGTNTTRVTVPSIAFACVDLTTSLLPGSGMVGFGRGSLSLVRQLGSPRFSYCLAPSRSPPTPSRLYFGEYATLQTTNMSSGGGPVQSTPFLTDPERPSLYFLNMTGISVGGHRLPIDPSVFAMDQDNGFFSGVIIDTVATITHLVRPAYDAVRAAFVSQIKLPLLNVTSPDGMNTCFMWPPPPRKSVTLPQLVFHFDGADMELPFDNYMMVDDKSGGLCLVMGPAGDVTVIGSFQQQNFHMLYDLKNSLLSFVPAPCNLV